MTDGHFSFRVLGLPHTGQLNGKKALVNVIGNTCVLLWKCLLLKQLLLKFWSYVPGSHEGSSTWSFSPADDSCLPVWASVRCSSAGHPGPVSGAILPPPAPLINSGTTALSLLPSLTAPQISLLSNPSMTGASLKMHRIQITLISFTLFIYFLWIPSPSVCFSAVSWWGRED